MTIALLRHGQTDWNLERRLQGSSDIPLNATGRQQASEVGDLLAAQRDEQDWTVVVSSPLSRARETGAIVAGKLGLELGPAYDGFAEIDFGVGEGFTIDEAVVRWPNWDAEGSETMEQVSDRGFAALEQVRADYPDQDVIIAAHGTVIRAIAARIAGVEPMDMPALDNTGRAIAAWTESGWTLLSNGGVPVVAEVDA
jgi:uncharacterized phosphatase